MHDWRRIVEARLGRVGAGDSADEEIVSELASHLEELYEQSRADGMNHSEALSHCLQELSESNHLRRRIRYAKEGEMNNRTKQFWLPGLAGLFAASVFLMAVTSVSYQPHMLVLRSSFALMIYPLWLAGQPIFGGIGAFFSKKAGGSRTTRTFAALTPTLSLLGLICFFVITRIVKVSLSGAGDMGSMNSVALLRALLFAVVIPGFASLLGALPFLKEGPEAA